MPTTFMGRDNNNNPCYHVRKGDGLSVADMKAGVQDDTLFHSSLPYLQVVETIDVGMSGEYSYGYDNLKVFNFPANLNNYLNNRYICLVSALLSDGSRVNIENIPLISSMVSEGLYDFGTRFIRPRSSASMSFAAINGFSFLNTAIGSGSLGDISTEGLRTNGYWPDNTNLACSAGSGSILQAGSRTCIYRSKRIGAYAYLSPVSIRFIILNITSLSSYINYSTINYSGDIKISPGGFFIGGSNILSGKGFLSVGSTNVGNGGFAQSNDYIGTSKMSLGNLNSLALPFGSSLYRFTNTGVSELNGYLSNSGMVITAPSGGGTVSQKEQWSSESQASSLVSTYSGKLSLDTFKISNIPSNISGCIFTKDNLTVNGVQLYSPNNSNLININTQPARLYIGAVQGLNVAGFTNGYTEVVATVSVQKPNSKLGILYNISHFGHNTDVVITCAGIGSTNNITFDMAAQSGSEYLGANLAILNIGDTIPICVCNSSSVVEISLMAAQGQYAYGGVGGGVTYLFYRLDINTIQILRRYSKFTFNNSPGNTTLSTPGFYLNYLQMTTSSIG